MKRIFNFSSGPATLPTSVLEQASQGVIEIQNSGMSVLEVSHRGPEYEKIHFEARDRLLRLMGLSNDTHAALFLGGGASTQFAMLPMNFLRSGESADFVHTGEWSGRAIQEAKRFGSASIAGSSEERKFSELPRELRWDSKARYVHLTTNNTIEGTQWKTIPDTGSRPLVADASSDLLWGGIDYSRFALIYAGAQKNLGPAGVTAVVVRRDLLEEAREDVPTIFSYRAHAKADSLYNTPPVFGVYVLGLTLEWLENQGGPKKMAELNRKKAELVYQALDAHPATYEPTVTRKEDRSLMNLTFRLRDSTREKDFLAGAEARGMAGLKGHRSVGGFRASIYNAFPREGCERLAHYLEDFAKKAR